jgi:hypothetical protein
MRGARFRDGAVLREGCDGEEKTRRGGKSRGSGKGVSSLRRKGGGGGRLSDQGVGLDVEEGLGCRRLDW